MKKNNNNKILKITLIDNLKSMIVAGKRIGRAKCAQTCEVTELSDAVLC